jgi:hypothetical protein
LYTLSTLILAGICPSLYDLYDEMSRRKLLRGAIGIAETWLVRWEGAGQLCNVPCTANFYQLPTCHCHWH